MDSEDLTPELLSWSIRPWEAAPGKLPVILGACLFAGFLGSYLTGSILIAIIGFVAVAASTSEFWLGTTYRLTEKEASARCGLSTTAMAWEDVKRVIWRESSVKLSPLPELSKLDPFRGVTIRTLGDNSETVFAYVRQHLPTEASVEETREK